MTFLCYCAALFTALLSWASLLPPAESVKPTFSAASDLRVDFEQYAAKTTGSIWVRAWMADVCVVVIPPARCGWFIVKIRRLEHHKTECCPRFTVFLPLCCVSHVNMAGQAC